MQYPQVIVDGLLRVVEELLAVSMRFDTHQILVVQRGLQRRAVALPALIARHFRPLDRARVTFVGLYDLPQSGGIPGQRHEAFQHAMIRTFAPRFFAPTELMGSESASLCAIITSRRGAHCQPRGEALGQRRARTRGCNGRLRSDRDANSHKCHTP